MKPNLKLHHLRDFAAIAEHRSVRGAARALNLAQPAITRSLRDLERELGASLVVRHARGIELTTVGTRFLVRAQSALQEVRRAREEVAQLSGEIQGTVSIALSTAPMLSLLPAAIQQFQKIAPDVSLHLVEGIYPAIESRLLDGHLDFYIGPLPERMPRSLRSELYFKNDRVVVARKRHPLLGARSLKELTAAQWVLTGLRERAEQEFEELFSAYKLPPPRSRVRVESTLGMLSILASTDMLALMPRQWTDSPMFGAILEPIRVKEKLPAPDIVLIARTGVPLTPVAEQLATLLLRAAGKPFKSR